MGIHGAIRNFTVNGRGFKVAHDGAGSNNLGGRNNEVEMNGDGSNRILQSVIPGSFSDVQTEIDNSRNDIEFLQNLADQGLPVPVVVTYADNTSYTGELVITGEIAKDAQTGLASLNMMGGKLTQL